MLTMGSLFDGIGGFPLAAVRNGIVPVWASEIEAFPIEVTKIRFPEMLHVGDITKLNGATLPPVDVICGGSPCQDLSVAGARRGLAGERSGLFVEQTRIAKEMRKADESRGTPAHLVRPRYLVWENVPGAFSSAEGEDFRAVIEEIIRIKDSTCDVPRPDTGRWESAGLAILGTEFSLAWRVLDAQYWGVAQRRRRIFLVADFAGRTAPEILFKQDSLFGDIAPCGGPWQGAAAPTEGGADDTGRACLTHWDVQVRATSAEVASRSAPAHLTGGNQFPPCAPHALQGGLDTTAVAFAANQRDEVRDLHGVAGALGAQPGMKQQTFVADATAVQAFHVNQRDEVIDLHGLSGALLATRNMQMQTFVTEPLICLNDHGGERMDITEELIPTLRAGMGGHAPLIAQPNCLNNWDTQQSRVFTPDGIAPTLAGADGGGGRNPAELLFAAGVVSKGDGDCFLTHETHISLTKGGGQAGQGYPCVLTAAFIPSAGVAAQSIGYQDECSPTIKTSNAPAVLCLNDQGGSVMSCSEDVVGTLRAQEHGHQPLVFDNHAQDSRFTGPVDVSQTVSAGFGMGGDVCDRSLWEMKGAIRSGSGQNLASESEQQILGTTTGNNLPLIMATQQGGAEIGAGICPTITASAGMSGNNQPVLFENHPKDGRYNGPLAVAPTLAARMGTGGNNVPLVGSAVAFSGSFLSLLTVYVFYIILNTHEQIGEPCTMDEFIKLLAWDLEYVSHNLLDNTFYISVRSIKEITECPFCGGQSSSVHSCYERSFRDLPIQGKPVVIQLHTRRMFCNNPECTHTTFAERYTFLSGNAKQTNRLKEHIVDVALETSSVAAAEVLGRNAVKTSKSTICLMLKKTDSIVDKR